MPVYGSVDVGEHNSGIPNRSAEEEISRMIAKHISIGLHRNDIDALAEGDPRRPVRDGHERSEVLLDLIAIVALDRELPIGKVVAVRIVDARRRIRCAVFEPQCPGHQFNVSGSAS